MRLEFNVPHCSVTVLKFALSWVLKILKMQNDRYPKICFNKLKEMYTGSETDKKFNWLHQLHTLLSTVNKQFILDIEDPGVFQVELKDTLILFKNYTEERDKQILFTPTRYSPVYPAMYTDSDSHQPYLTLNAPFPMTKILAQIRLAGNYHIKLTFNNIYYYFKPKENCSLCNLNEFEDLFHIFVRCPIYAPFRHHFLPHSSNMTRSNFMQLFKIDNVDSLKMLFYYTKQCCMVKSFIINE